MPVILIADACKPSLVMSSEVFKDKISGAYIHVATTGRQCLELMESENPDICVVDFDLPDTDGVTLISTMRKKYQGPILLTAYPDPVVTEAVNSDLFAFNDAGGWIPKPVKFDVLSEKIDRFLMDKFRVGRRFPIEMETLVIGKGAGRGKRAPKASGKIVNLSLDGACVHLEEPMQLEGGQELTVALTLPDDTVQQAKRSMKKTTTTKKTKAKTTTGGKAEAPGEAKIKCKVAWVDENHGKAGFQFNRLTDVQKRGLELLLRDVSD